MTSPNDKDIKVAAICTTYYPGSHADVIVSRWLDPHPTDAHWGWQPRTTIASLYVAQFPPGLALFDLPKSQWRTLSFRPDLDLARPTAREYGVPIFDTIREALTLGGDALAVDGVLLIGEHGDYSVNAHGQTLYPRKEFFDEIVAVFRASGRAAPVFCDKHLSWNIAWAQEMVAAACELGFPLMAGSSLPYSFNLIPSLPPGADLIEGVMVFYGGAEVYGFHSLEAMQRFIETRASPDPRSEGLVPDPASRSENRNEDRGRARTEDRGGGERGIRAITVYKGDDVWAAMEQGAWSRELFDAALAACQNPAPGDMRENCRKPSSYDDHGSPTAFVLEHDDGLRTAHVQLEGHIQDFGLAVRQSNGTVHTNRWEEGSAQSFYGHFAALDAKIQAMFLTGQPPAPIERTLLTTMTIASCMHALATPGIRIETPHLHVTYQTPA
jgi:hypothetical protein